MAKFELTDLFLANKSIQNWISQIGEGRQLVMGLSSSSKALAIATAFKTKKGKMLLITSTQNEAEQLMSDLATLIDDKYLYHFFADDVAAAEFLFSSLDRTMSRLESLTFLQDREASGILVTSKSKLSSQIKKPSPLEMKWY